MEAVHRVGEADLRVGIAEAGGAVRPERLGQPEQVAAAVAFLASPAAEFVCGASLVVDGGVLRAL